MKRLLFAALAAALFAVALPAHAQTTGKPILSLDRLGLSAGANYAWHAGESLNLPKFKKEWEAGIFAAYNLTPTLDLVGSTLSGLDNKTFRSSVGLRVALKPVKE